jgi:hypothetical protein
MKDVKKLREQSQNPGSTDKKKRKKAFAKIKDTLHKNCGKPIFSGIGDGKPIICDFCKKEVQKATFKDGKWCCQYCERT